MNVGDVVKILDCDYRWTPNGFVEHKPEYVGKQGVITAIDGIKLYVNVDGEELILHKSSVSITDTSSIKITENENS